MSDADQRLRRATRELRTRLGLSQAEFGRRIGRTLNTVLRYESQVAPKGDALVPYAALAIKCGFNDLAVLFRAALLEEFGTDLERVIAWHPGPGTWSMDIPEDARPLVEAFLAFMSAPSRDLQPAEELARSSLKQLLLNEYSAAHLHRSKKSSK